MESRARPPLQPCSLSAAAGRAASGDGADGCLLCWLLDAPANSATLRRLRHCCSERCRIAAGRAWNSVVPLKAAPSAWRSPEEPTAPPAPPPTLLLLLLLQPPI